MVLLPSIDAKKTRQKARAVLNQYRTLQRIAGRPSVDLKAPIITDMPKCVSHKNKTEDAVIQRVDAEIERDAIVRALASLSAVNRLILYYTYCDVERRSNYYIAQELGYTDKNIERLKPIALVEFAEAYKAGKLITHEK